MQHILQKRSAFTMIELIFVITILGIVASLGSEIIARVYETYIIQRAQHKASLKTELAAIQIANRLRYAIPGTVYRIKNDDSREPVDASLPGGTTGDDYKGLQWVAYDGDSFEAIASSSNRLPGWSGFCDLNDSSPSSIRTPGSNLALTNTIIQKLSSGTGSKTLSDAVIYFPGDNTAYGVNSAVAGPNLTLDSNVSTIVEQYKLAWTSYALVVDANNDLYLYYNFSPVPGVARGNIKSLLLKNVTNFKFQASGRTIRFKICKEESIGDINISSCKEKAVF